MGRDRERRLVAELLDGLTHTGESLVVVGDPGIGKTALLGEVQEMAAGARADVVTARGVESETTLPFAALGDLLRPLAPHFAGLPQTQREALEASLGLAPGRGHGPLATCAGTLGVLAAAAHENGLVVLVDDLHWVDPESAQVLLFVARRLRGERILLVLTTREPGARAAALRGLPTLRLDGLTGADCAELARAHGVHLAPGGLAGLARATGGNPLAVTEFLRRQGAAGGTPGQAVAALPGYEPLERSWARLWQELDRDGQAALFVVTAAEGLGDAATSGALAALGLDPGSLDGARTRGLVEHADGQTRLRHPLMRAIVTTMTPADLQRECLEALASATQGLRRVWFRALASPGPDAALADELQRAAADERLRNGLSASAKAFHRAAVLTADDRDRARMLLRAATEALLAGELQLAVDWGEEALAAWDDPAFAVDVNLVSCRARSWLEDPAGAVDRLVNAARRVTATHPEKAVMALAEATPSASMLNRLDLLEDLVEQIEGVWAAAPGVRDRASSVVLAQMATSLVIRGRVGRAHEYARTAGERSGGAGAEVDLQGRSFLAQSFTWSEDFDRAAREVAVVVDAGRRLGSPFLLAFGLGVGGDIGWWTGRWTAAYGDVAEALQWATDCGQPVLIGYALWVLGRLEAGRGNRAACEALALRQREEIVPCGVAIQEPIALAQLGLLALGEGDLDSAAADLQDAWDVLVRGGLGNANVVPHAGDLAEALARRGDVGGCERVVRWLEERADATGLRHPRSVALRARGIVAGSADEAVEHLETSLSVLRETRMPFEEARTLLCLGEALRRDRRRTAAREPLRAALRTFDALGAAPWSRRTRAELEATGERPRTPAAQENRSADVLGALTPQELQIAMAAGRGLNNVEIAASLFLSRKTVEAHLTRVYRKTSVRSRTELARLLLTHGVID